MDFLRQIQVELEQLNGIENPHDVRDFVRLNESENALVVREEGDDAEVAVLLHDALVQSYEGASFPNDFEFSQLADLSIIIEELSHFCLYCAKATNDRSLSPIEMEVQAEVDKFALALRWLEAENEEALKHRIYEQIFENYHFREELSDRARLRYQEAHLIAKNFCRQFVRNGWGAQDFRDFFSRPRSEKLRLPVL